MSDPQTIISQPWSDKLKHKVETYREYFFFDEDSIEIQMLIDIINYTIENDESKCEGCERVDPDECYQIVCDNPPERW
ncbi:MAG: hypothetical protein WC365_06845 [Candidatus Babeliales bacterium]|jgi:hypothetical protein